MNNLKFFKLISASLLILTLDNMANAAPITYTGSKGQYTVDKEAGTYKGCRFKQNCILLGPNEKIAPTSWKNGDYTYSVNVSTVHIYEKNKEIFQDSFVNTQASAAKPTTPEVKYGLITPKCIDSACLGMTYGQLKAKLGKKFKFKNYEALGDGQEATEVVQDGKTLYRAIYNLTGQKFRDSDKVTRLETDNGYYRTKEGVGPGTSVIQAQRIYGKAILTRFSGCDNLEYLKFSKLSKGYQQMWFRPKVKSELEGDSAGIYPKSPEKYGDSLYKAIKIKPNAYIYSVEISKD